MVAQAYGYVAPFLLACLPLGFCGIIVGVYWPENYGNQETKTLDVLKNAATVIGRDYRVSALGIGQALFEGAMYTFVFVWTPALKETVRRGGDIENSSDYLGLVFATFMVCMMIGRYDCYRRRAVCAEDSCLCSLVFQLSTSYVETTRPALPLLIHGAAAAANFTASSFTAEKTAILIMFLIFEVCVGMFYPVGARSLAYEYCFLYAQC
jgi:hypothetical protein